MEDDKRVLKLEDDTKDYIITVRGGGKNREIRLSAGMFNFGVMSAIIGVFLFIGACGYSVFSALHYRQNIAAINEARRAGEMQQEQLLSVSKKASALSETLQNLAQQEEELRIQAGVEKPAREDKVDEFGEEFDVENLPPIGDWTSPTPENLEAPVETPAVVETPAPVETPAVVENPAPQIHSEWTPPAPLPVQENPAPVETPAVVETPAPQIQSEWTPPAPLPVQENPAPVETPAVVETPAPQIQSEWTPPAPLPVQENPAPVETPAVVETPAPQIQSQWTPPAPLPVQENPAPVETPAVVENPAPQIQSQWTPPAPLPVQENPAPVETLAAVENPAPQIQSQWTPPAPLPVQENPAPVETPAVVETPAPQIQSEWKPPVDRGQGGPNEALKVDDVSEALAMLEQRVNIRADSLNDFQNELKIQREQMSFLAAVPTNSPEMLVIDEGYVFNPTITFDLSSFAGTPSVNPNMPSIWPTNGVVSSPYGLRWGGTDFHPGIDIANDMGTPIVATADGVIEYAGWNSGGYGNMVDINHGNGIMTRYGHASQVVVTVGQYVKRGQLIAYMGSTGFSTGPHVHYEVHVNGQRVNPISYL